MKNDLRFWLEIAFFVLNTHILTGLGLFFIETDDSELIFIVDSQSLLIISHSCPAFIIPFWRYHSILVMPFPFHLGHTVTISFWPYRPFRHNFILARLSLFSHVIVENFFRFHVIQRSKS